MRVYMAPCGVGLGHITRSEAISRIVVQQGGEVIFSTYGDGVGYARKMRLKLAKTVPVMLHVREDGSVDFKSTATRSGLSLGLRTFIRQVLAEIRNLKSFKPDVVFSDSRASTLVAAKLLGIPVVLMLNQYRVNIVRRPSAVSLSIGDRVFFIVANIAWTFFSTLLQGLWSTSDQILIPDFAPPYTISLRNLAIPKRHTRKVRLIGPVVTMKPSQILQNSYDIRRRFGFDISKPLVYVAVSGPKIERRYLTRILERVLAEVNFDCQIIMSKGETMGSKGTTIGRQLVIFDWLEEEIQYQLLKACDLVISRAGHGIIGKAMTFGKPMILIPIPDHTEQLGNARQAARLGFAKILDQDKIDAASLSQAIRSMLSSEIVRSKAHEMSVFTENLDAVKTAAGLILGLANPSQTPIPSLIRISSFLEKATSTRDSIPSKDSNSHIRLEDISQGTS